ncbi:MAG: tRNA (adenosine(37)-N6)-threonylcarbamoyltransferase complex ATPase subunit type 1 TsaE [Pirellulales bacterium]|nr:tRNA (adenosine(37)-N6)-threonylcarbamoyltransferase complex ATPase subunit type 1 TsaE [Pirellulales bacterium]
MPITVHLQDEAATQELARALAAAIAGPQVIGLIGTLGAGKTRFVQALAQGLGIDPQTVQSPTFALIHEYQGRRRLCHFDAYRLRDEDEFEALGPEEYFEADAVCVVEWSDRVARCLPDDRIEVSLEITSPTSRRITFEAFGPRSTEVLARLGTAKNLGRIPPD